MPLRAALACWLVLMTPAAAAWRAEIVPAPGAVTAVERDGTAIRIAVGDIWYQLADDGATLQQASPPDLPKPPADALPDGRVARGSGTVARAWFAAPTRRYDHGVLGDAIEAGSLMVKRRDGSRGSLTLGADAVFEDLWPRLASIDGRDWIVAVKSYLARGSALAVIDPADMRIVAETPPIGHSHAWLNPAGIADFDGDGVTEIALVRQPHAVGQLELWSFRDRKLTKRAEVGDVANHFIGSRALGMAWTADFDGDGHPDLAIPSFDRRSLRLIGFAPAIRDIARIALPAQVATNIGSVTLNGRIALLAGLADGRLLLIRDQ